MNTKFTLSNYFIDICLLSFLIKCLLNYSVYITRNVMSLALQLSDKYFEKRDFGMEIH